MRSQAEAGDQEQGSGACKHGAGCVCSADEDSKRGVGRAAEECIKEYLKRTDTAVIFPEPVSAFALKDDCLTSDPEQDDKKRGDQAKSKVAGSASEY